jgi:hypothetical protein
VGVAIAESSRHARFNSRSVNGNALMPTHLNLLQTVNFI